MGDGQTRAEAKPKRGAGRASAALRNAGRRGAAWAAKLRPEVPPLLAPPVAGLAPRGEGRRQTLRLPALRPSAQLPSRPPVMTTAFSSFTFGPLTLGRRWWDFHHCVLEAPEHLGPSRFRRLKRTRHADEVTGVSMLSTGPPPRSGDDRGKAGGGGRHPHAPAPRLGCGANEPFPGQLESSLLSHSGSASVSQNSHRVSEQRRKQGPLHSSGDGEDTWASLPSPAACVPSPAVTHAHTHTSNSRTLLGQRRKEADQHHRPPRQRPPDTGPQRDMST